MEKNINPKFVQSLWIGSQLSNVEKLCIKSFLDHGYDFHLYTYEEIKNAPKGTIIMDANNIIEKEAIFRYKTGWAKNSVSGFADLFRLLLIQKNGGWWVDMDIICLNNLPEREELVFCSSYEGDYGELVNNCIFKAPANHPFFTYCLDEISKIDLPNMDFGLAGPFLFQRVVKELQLEGYIFPYQCFNPITWKNVGELILNKRSRLSRLKEIFRPALKPDTMAGRKIEKNSFTLHLWNEVWKNYEYDKNGNYGKFSLFEKLKRKHKI
ncbi:glycosyltransferase [Pedobacter aquatilis]|uniref:glycosyltransferase n=1 Tax=Pedobacter aquatilis TaxID=351343 RepID=UPI00292E5E18|nr:glycosyltransferase [Pedobacter aquatilis]